MPQKKWDPGERDLRHRRRRRTPSVEEPKMKKLVIAAATALLMTSTAHAAKVGVSMALFDDNFLTVLRNGIQSYADENGHTVQIEDAQNDVAKQLDQINNFIASRRRRDHREPGRHLGDAGDVRRRRRRQRAAGLRQPPADQPRHAARQPGLRRLERGRLRHARDQGGLPPAQGGRQDRGQRLRDHGRALEPGRGAAHAGHPRRDRRHRTAASRSTSSTSRPRTGTATKRRT